MQLLEAFEKLKQEAIEIPLKNLFRSEAIDRGIDWANPPARAKMKGVIAQMLESWIGINPGSANLDFEDGELKINHCKSDYRPVETIAITMLTKARSNEDIDKFLSPSPMPFEKTMLSKKITNQLIVPIFRPGRWDANGRKRNPEDYKPGDWYFLNAFHVNCNRGSQLYKQVKLDYYDVCAKMKNFVETDGRIRTSNGKYLQVRTKDAGGHKNKPIVSELYGRQVSKCRMAWYFKPSLVLDIRSGNLEAEIAVDF